MESAAETVGSAVHAAHEALDDARQTSGGLIPAAADRARVIVRRAGELTPSDKERDQILLGAAALALAAAVGIAAQRRK
jgi:hypothetical protein